MNLREYLDEKDIKHKKFAKDIGVSVKTLWIIMNEGTNNFELAMRIEIATKKKVKCKTLLPKEVVKKLKIFKNF